MNRFAFFLIWVGLVGAILADSMKKPIMLYVGIGVMVIGGVILILGAYDVISVKKPKGNPIYCPKCHHRLPDRGFTDHCPICGCKFTIGKMNIRMK